MPMRFRMYGFQTNHTFFSLDMCVSRTWDSGRMNSLTTIQRDHYTFRKLLFGAPFHPTEWSALIYFQIRWILSVICPCWKTSLFQPFERKRTTFKMLGSCRMVQLQIRLMYFWITFMKRLVTRLFRVDIQEWKIVEEHGQHIVLTWTHATIFSRVTWRPCLQTETYRYNDATGKHQTGSEEDQWRDV